MHAHVSSRECPRFRHPGRRSDRRHPPRSAGDGLLRSRRLEGSRTRYHEPRADGLARHLTESRAAARGPRSSVPGALWFPGPRVCGTSSPGRGSRAPGRVSQPAGSRAAAVTGRAECARVCARVRAGSPSRVCGSPQSHRRDVPATSSRGQRLPSHSPSSELSPVSTDLGHVENTEVERSPDPL